MRDLISRNTFSADAVPVVRCKRCKYWVSDVLYSYTNFEPVGICKFMKFGTRGGEFCSMGKALSDIDDVPVANASDGTCNGGLSMKLNDDGFRFSIDELCEKFEVNKPAPYLQTYRGEIVEYLSSKLSDYSVPKCVVMEIAQYATAATELVVLDEWKRATKVWKSKTRKAQ